MWLELLEHLRGYLSKENIAGKCYVTPVRPSVNMVTYEGAILLMRIQERQGASDLHQEVEASLFIELWVREDSQNIEDWYSKISSLEEKLDSALTNFRDACHALNQEACVFGNRWQIADIYVTDKRGSDDSSRPLIGTQYEVTARIFDLKEEKGIW